MAVRINLLPHRKIRRAERQKQFTFMLGGSLAAGVAIVLLGLSYINGRIDHQQDRNQRLQSAIAQLDKEIAEIKDLKSRIGDVLERKRVVENLQLGRGRAVLLLDELARQLPEGIYLRSAKQQGSTITLEGIADTNARVAILVSNLSKSQWLESPELIEIHAVNANRLKQSAFSLRVKQKAQKQPDESEKK
jgi:type IV pilus assembly protein PilN